MTESATDTGLDATRDEQNDDVVPAEDVFGTVPMTDGGTPPLELQEIYDILSDPRRRRCVEYVAENGPADISEITDVISGEEIGAGASGQARKRVYISVYQNHLPKLVEEGVLERTDREYAPGPNFEQMLAVINQVEDVYDEYRDPSPDDGGAPDGGVDLDVDGTDDVRRSF